MLDAGDDGQGELVMPFYLVCDVSLSMRTEIVALHDGITRLWQAASMPVVDDLTRMSVITFSGEARVVVPLSRMSECKIPDFAHENSTPRYGNAFRVLAEEMAEDYAMLRRMGARVYRPCVYFLTDGEPSDRDWRQTFKQTLTAEALALRDMPSYALIVPFGFRNATERTMQGLVYPRDRSKYYHASNVTIDGALMGLLGIIKKSVLNSQESMLAGELDLDLPMPIPGSGITRGDGGSGPDD
jgi:uncharacterized protein YegL